MSTTTKCKGCGATLQTLDSTKVGYALSLEHTYCQHCYKLFHYGDAQEHFHPEDLPNLGRDAVVFMISSVLNLDMLFNYPVYRYEPNLKYVYLINQIDLLPKSTNLDEMLKNIIIKAKKMRVPYHDIILMSAINPRDIKHLHTYMDEFKETNLYLIGVQNSGKTTIFKGLTKDDQALAMNKAGLTQEALSRPLNKHHLYDMPGLYQDGYIHQFLPYQTYKRLIPNQMIKPRIYQLRKNQTIFIEGLIALTVSAETQTLVLYIENHVKVHKTNENRVKELLVEKEKHFDIYVDTYEEKSFKLTGPKMQITFADIGFAHIEGLNTIKAVYPKNMHMSLSEALFK